MSKSTPLEQLPRPESNVQMNVQDYQQPMPQVQQIPQKMPQQMQQQMQQVQQVVPQPVYEPKESYLNLLYENSKLLGIIFVLLMAAQMETTQVFFRNITRMANVSDSMVFMASKVLISLVGVFAFLFAYKNLY
jgi:hypothetical protein